MRLTRPSLLLYLFSRLSKSSSVIFFFIPGMKKCAVYWEHKLAPEDIPSCFVPLSYKTNHTLYQNQLYAGKGHGDKACGMLHIVLTAVPNYWVWIRGIGYRGTVILLISCAVGAVFFLWSLSFFNVIKIMHGVHFEVAPWEFNSVLAQTAFC